MNNDRLGRSLSKPRPCFAKPTSPGEDGAGHEQLRGLVLTLTLHHGERGEVNAQAREARTVAVDGGNAASFRFSNELGFPSEGSIAPGVAVVRRGEPLQRRGITSALRLQRPTRLRSATRFGTHKVWRK